jgi:hypothetical protein
MILKGARFLYFRIEDQKLIIGCVRVLHAKWRKGKRTRRRSKSATRRCAASATAAQRVMRRADASGAFCSA